MSLRQTRFFAAAALISAGLASGIAQAAPEKALTRIAYSAKAGVEVFAETATGNWCEEVPSLKLFAREETAFDSSALTKLMEKTGAVIQKECPAAKQVILDGYANNTLVYQGSASRGDNWKPEKGLLNVKVVQLQRAGGSSGSKKSPFAVREWTPPTTKHLAKIDEKTALEHPVYTKDRRCAVLYTSDKPASVLKKWHIDVRDNSCAERLIYGKAQVDMYNEKGRLETTVNGYFTEGRFTGRKNWNALLLNRYGYDRNLQNMSYLIDTDFDLKIYYLGYLQSRRNARTGRYSAWKGCEPFVISAVTENEDLFLQNAVTDNILRSAQTYADVFCPSASQMKFFATTVPRGIAGMDEPESKKSAAEDDTRLIYAVTLQKEKGRWRAVSDKTKNLARLRELARRGEEAREHQLMMADYNELAKADFLGRLAYMHGFDTIDNALSAGLAARVLKKPVTVNLLVNVQSAGKSKSWANWPVDLQITDSYALIKRAGWYIVSGELSAQPPAERAKRNDPFAAKLDVSAATACEKDGCAEASDLIGLVRRRHDKPDWTPYRLNKKGKTP